MTIKAGVNPWNKTPIFWMCCRKVTGVASVLHPPKQALRRPANRLSDQAGRGFVREFALFRRDAGHLLADRIGNAQLQRGNDGRHQGKAGQRIKSAGEAAGIVLRPTDHRRPEEAAEIADGIDPGDSGAAAVSGQQAAGQARPHRPDPLFAVLKSIRCGSQPVTKRRFARPRQ